MTIRSRGAAPYAILGISQLAVGAAAIFARYALTGAHPIAVSAARLIIASVILLTVGMVRRSPDRVRATGKQNVLFIGGGLCLAIHFVGWISSLEYTTVAVSTLLVTTTPIWTALYDTIFLKRPLSWVAWAAFGAGGVGLLLVVGFTAAAPPISGHGLLGAILALIGAFAIGAYWILVREVRDRFGTRAIVTRTYSWAALALLIATLFARQSPPPLSDGIAWGGILAMAIISQLIGHTALNACLKWFTPNAISFATVLEPVIAAVLALLIFHETLGGVAIAGGIVLLTAIGVVLREERRREVLDLAL
ncbi:MAG: DMT family transporter [Candidatus Eremiobacteraeota bacterium]|nr:DMT family transporter [Candidatus Eremiobacteraeota bacterium]